MTIRIDGFDTPGSRRGLRGSVLGGHCCARHRRGPGRGARRTRRRQPVERAASPRRSISTSCPRRPRRPTSTWCWRSGHGPTSRTTASARHGGRGRAGARGRQAGEGAVAGDRQPRPGARRTPLAPTRTATRTFVAGIKHVHADVLAALERAGIEPYSPEGERFDPQFHEAVAQQPCREAPSPGRWSRSTSAATGWARPCCAPRGCSSRPRGRAADG